jgi:hypothetical protein
MFSITRDNVDELYSETLWLIQAHHILEETRGGPVMSLDQPICWALTNPRNRVLINPVRDANPFFHVMEFIWMMSGEREIDWVTQFSKNYGNYAENGQGYGFRWRNFWQHDQIFYVIENLKKDPNTRRAVLEMWSPSDLEHTGIEVPCNTHIYFRKLNGKLDMTVLNRSNDIIWGALGANVVHMTMLHELVAFGAGIPLGTYRAISNNAHVYQNLPNREKLFEYKETGILVEQCRPILREGERWQDFLTDCENMVYNHDRSMQTQWMGEVTEPMFSNFFNREGYSQKEIQCPAWRKACELWLERRKK